MKIIKSNLNYLVKDKTNLNKTLSLPRNYNLHITFLSFCAPYTNLNSLPELSDFLFNLNVLKIKK